MAWHSQGDVSVLALTGRLDAYSALPVAEWFDEAVTHRPADVGEAEAVASLAGAPRASG